MQIENAYLYQLCDSFLDLIASSLSSFLVPTLDIDLAWHTHQLKANTYNTDCVQFLGRTIDQ
jgi:hypothetical protein